METWACLFYSSAQKQNHIDPIGSTCGAHFNSTIQHVILHVSPAPLERKKTWLNYLTVSKTALSNGLNNAFTTFSPRPTQTQTHKSEIFFFFLVLFQWLNQLNPGAQSLWVTHLKGRCWFDVLHTASLHIFPSCCLSSCNPLISVTCFTSNKLKMMLFSFLSAVHKVLLCLYKKRQHPGDHICPQDQVGIA